MKRGDAHRQSKRDSHRYRPLISRDLPAGTLRSLRKDLKKQSRRYRKRLKRCQKEFSEKAVHALRVQSRRLLSTIELLEHFLPTNHLDCIRHALKYNLDIFDDLRDNQVQILAIGKMRRNFPAARSFYALLQRQEKKSIRQAHRDVQKATGRRLKKLIATARKRDWNLANKIFPCAFSAKSNASLDWRRVSASDYQRLAVEQVR